jgi:hypothetical protein
MEEPNSMPSFWHGIAEGGPLVMALCLSMVISFCLALVFSFRRPGSVAAFACSGAPFVFGAAALWLGVVGVLAVISGVMYEGGTVERLRLVQRPFFLGTGLSCVAFIVYSFARALNSKTRNA